MNEKITLRLFVADDAPDSSAAVEAVRSVLEELAPEPTLEVVDVFEDPAAAAAAEAPGTPVLVVHAGGETRQLAAELSDRAALGGRLRELLED